MDLRAIISLGGAGMIYQSEATECGLACVAMVAQHHGCFVSLRQLREQLRISLQGTSLHDVSLLAQHLGLRTRAVKCELDELAQLALPAILHWDMHHFVVVTAVHKNSIRIADPAVGERTVQMKEVNGRFTGIALECHPAQHFVKSKPQDTLHLRDFYRCIPNLTVALVKVFVLSFILQGLVLAIPFYTQVVVDEVLVNLQRDLLSLLAVGFGFLFVFKVLNETLRSWLLLYINTRFGIQIHTMLFQHLMALPLRFFAARHIGDVLSKFGSLHEIRTLITDKMVASVIDGLLSILVFVLLCLYHLQLALMILAVIVALGLIQWFMHPLLRNQHEQVVLAGAQEQSYFIESVRGIEGIKLFGAKPKRIENWLNHHIHTANCSYRLGKWEISLYTLQQLLLNLLQVGVVFIVAKAVLAGHMSIGMLFAFLAYKQQFTTRMLDLLQHLLAFRLVNLHLERVADIALHAPEQETNNPVQHSLSGALNVSGLCAQHHSNMPAQFTDIHFSVQAGEYVAVVGETGIGKSTLLKLCTGLLEPQHGTITVDGYTLAQLGQAQYLRQVAVVMQQDVLLSGTLAENIACFAEPVEMQKVIRAAQSAYIHDDIMQMPLQYQSVVTDMGNNLSGGQKQRLLIARALYHEPKILFLDEATSHLDLHTEQRVNAALVSLSCTVIAVAHRPHTILQADRILELRKNMMIDVTKSFRSKYQQTAKNTN
jgi:ATP-binding cassette subfamily B protein RaxB